MLFQDIDTCSYPDNVVEPEVDLLRKQIIYLKPGESMYKISDELTDFNCDQHSCTSLHRDITYCTSQTKAKLNDTWPRIYPWMGGHLGRCTLTNKSDYSCFPNRSFVRKYYVSGVVARCHRPLC